MSKTIWKYPLRVVDSQSVVMPRDAEILCVNVQGESLCVWAEVVPEGCREHRHFEIRDTGQPIDPAMDKKYLGTGFLADGLVVHVFEKTRI